MKDFVPVEEARALILDRLAPQPSERVPLADLAGRMLAAPVVSREAIPPFDNSAMDGFAVRVEDLGTLPAVLRVTEEIPAGRHPQRRVEAGACARIMTGAPFPEGADAVAPVEWTEPGAEGTVRFLKAPAPGQHVRRAGRDVQQGAVVVEAGAVVTPPVVGVLAMLGYAEADAAVPPRVAVLSTGDELVDPAATPGPGQIRDSNGPSLAAQARHAGAAVLPPFRARDDEAALRAALKEALEADVLLFSGGVSVGDYDLVRQVLDAMGMERVFWRVRQRPGKPLAYGTLRGRHVFGLPGNPVSSAMCFEQYVRPALAALLGRREVLRPRHTAHLAEPLAKKAGLYHFVRGVAAVTEEGRLQVRATGDQASNLYTSVLRANCIIHLPEALEDPPAGTAVEIEWLRW
ncbi:MAG: molybdopterin molybdotransferase MoeA [Rhodothermales bacterium]|nr:molybdopterin molybdotransferase MoeA [Rhodothermales bacterium]